MKNLRHDAVSLAVLFAIYLVSYEVFHQAFTNIDFAVIRFFAPVQTIVWSHVFLLITFFGSTEGIILIAILAAGYFWIGEINIKFSQVTFIALLGSTISVEILKTLIARPRPFSIPWVPVETGFSFPSGHTTAATVLYGAIAFTLFSRARTTRGKILSVAVPGALIFLVGISRVALNYHYATDVIAAFILGAFWIVFSLYLLEKKA